MPFLNFVAASIISFLHIFRSVCVTSNGFRKQMKKTEILLYWIPHPGVAGGPGDGVAVPQPPAEQRPGKRSLSPVCASLEGNKAICPQFCGCFLPAEL